MNYKILNDKNRKSIKQFIKSDYQIGWEDENLMKKLLGVLPMFQASVSNSEISKLEKTIKDYNQFFTDKKVFLEHINSLLTSIRESVNDRSFRINMNEIVSSVKAQDFCVIYGYGGIGKTFFIAALEEKLDSMNINHLCIYGKVNKNIKQIDVAEIVKVAEKEGFVLVVDAINELPEDEQSSLLDILESIRHQKGMRFVVTYRTYTLKENIKNRLKNLSSAELIFSGVSFESALDELVKLGVPNVTKYEDILQTNNALLLSFLFAILSNSKLKNERIPDLTRITYIYEHYIKEMIDKSWGKKIHWSKREIWEDTKTIAKWLYQNEKKSINERTLLSIVKSGSDYLLIMKQSGLIDSFEYEGEIRYYFTVDSLSDYLIARSLHKDIEGKQFDEQVSIIKKKAENIFGLGECFVLLLFDKYSPNYAQIKQLIKAADLDMYLNFELIIKTQFKSEYIRDFMNVFNCFDEDRLLENLGGYANKPFNCTNYLNERFFDNNGASKVLTRELSGMHFHSKVIRRLKNILYLLCKDPGYLDANRMEEAYSFAFWCCAAPNKNIRYLARKLLYQIIQLENYKNKVINDYSRITDDYIKEGIIHALSYSKRNDPAIEKFFYQIIDYDPYLTAKSLKRISIYFGNPYVYINWNRENLYHGDNETSTVSEFMHQILIRLEYTDSVLSMFSYWGKDHFDIKVNFLGMSKTVIQRINHQLEDNYSCIRSGECNGSPYIKEWIKEKGILDGVALNRLNKYAIVNSLETVIKSTLIKYYGDLSNYANEMRYDEYQDSRIMKCIDIATGLFFGSLMCNYYEDSFTTYNSEQDCLGFEVYDPIPFDEEINIATPIAVFQEYTEELNEIISSRIIVPSDKNEAWVNDIESLQKHVLISLEPICGVDGKEWIPLAASFRFQERNDHGLVWQECFDFYCCTSSSETITDDENTRYLTIELDSYFGCLRDYKHLNNRNWLCKQIESISSGSSVFDDTTLVVPPATIIDYFDLDYYENDACFRNKNGELVIRCDNSKKSYYLNQVCGSVYMLKEYFESYKRDKTIKYFAYAERYFNKTGYPEDVQKHYEIADRHINKIIPNHLKISDNSHCMECPHAIKSFIESNRASDTESLQELLKQYGITNDDND